MPNLPRLARLQTLHHSLATAVRVTEELAANESMVRLAAEDPDRWNFVLDSLSASMESGEMGSLRQVCTALGAALED